MTFSECFMNIHAMTQLLTDCDRVLFLFTFQQTWHRFGCKHNAWSIFLLESCCIIFYKFFSPHKLYSQATISRDDSTHILNVLILCWQKKFIQIWDCLGGSIFLFEMMVALMIIYIRIWYLLINFSFPYEKYLVEGNKAKWINKVQVVMAAGINK